MIGNIYLSTSYQLSPQDSVCVCDVSSCQGHDNVRILTTSYIFSTVEMIHDYMQQPCRFGPNIVSACLCALSVCVCGSCLGPRLNVSHLIWTLLDSLTSPGSVTSPSVSSRWQRDSRPTRGSQHANEHTHAQDNKSGKWYMLEGLPLFSK